MNSPREVQFMKIGETVSILRRFCYNSKKIKENKMKKFLILMVISMALFFASCSNDCKNCPTCPAEQNDILVMEFQNGVWPNALYAGCEDTMISSLNTGTNYSASTSMYFGQNGSGVTQRALINFDISAIAPLNAVIVKAYLTLRHAGYTSYVDKYTANVPSSVWMTGFATWINRLSASAWATPGGISAPAVPASDEVLPNSTSDYIIFALDTSVVQGWLASPYLSRGVVMKSAVEDGNDHMMYAYSSDHATPAYRPKLTVYYRLP